MKDIHIILVTLVLWVSITMTICGLMGCEQKPDHPSSYSLGDFVQHALSDVKGQVTCVWRYEPTKNSWLYEVRWVVNTGQTNISWLGPDEDIQIKPFASVTMWEFEIKPYELEK